MLVCKICFSLTFVPIISFLQGLVATNLELGKVKEAAACAREAISCMPRSSLGYLAMGMVFSVSQPNSAEVSCSIYFYFFVMM